jgi:hypothetical protein
MKTSLFLVLILFNLPSYSQTTLDEYNYITKGYKIQTESGLDIKKGYEVEDITSASADLAYKDSGATNINRKAWLKALYKVNGPSRKLAAYMVIYQRADDEKEYICIPHPNSATSIKQRFMQALYDGNDKVNVGYRLQVITYLLTGGLKW